MDCELQISTLAVPVLDFLDFSFGSQLILVRIGKSGRKQLIFVEFLTLVWPGWTELL
jgi:hypothetical protein